MAKGEVSDVENLFEYFFKLLVIIVVFTVIFILIKSGLNYNTDIFDAESNIFMYSLMHSKGGLSSYDPQINRIYPGVIEIERFIKENFSKELEEAVYYSTSHIGARMTLYDQNGLTLGEAYYNREGYQKWMPIARTKAKGKGGARSVEKSFYVLLSNASARARYDILLDEEYGKMNRVEQLQRLSRLDQDTLENAMLIPGKLVMTVVIPNT